MTGHKPVSGTDKAQPVGADSCYAPPVSPCAGLPHRKTPAGNTRALHLNYVRGRDDKLRETELAHLRFFISVAMRLGLQLQIFTHVDSRGDIDQELPAHVEPPTAFYVIESALPITKWAEDGVEYLDNGAIAILPPLNDQQLATAMTVGRQHRWQGKVSQSVLTAALEDDALWIPLGVRVNLQETTAAVTALAAQTSRPVVNLRAYIEGGNMIAGEDAAGQPILLVGKDAIDATAQRYQLTREQVQKIVCEDFGLAAPTQVVMVEQPGQFHLDLALLFIGQGVVVLNDSSAALADAVEMAELVPCMTTETAAARLGLQHALEEAAAKDLQSAGLSVIRQALADNVMFNFFNGEFVTGKDGLNYYLTNGAPPAQEERFSQLMVEEWQVVSEVIFTPREAAQKSLQQLGGVGCRAKGLPR